MSSFQMLTEIVGVNNVCLSIPMPEIFTATKEVYSGLRPMGFWLVRWTHPRRLVGTLGTVSHDLNNQLPIPRPDHTTTL